MFKVVEMPPVVSTRQLVVPPVLLVQAAVPVAVEACLRQTAFG